MQNDWPAVTDWTAAYDNRAAIPDHEDLFEAWSADAATYRSRHAPEEIAYGRAEREKLDLFRPEGAPKGLMIFIHGGWWMNFGREYFSHLAAGAVAHGWAVAVPSYTLCPDIDITGICAQVADAVRIACERVPQGPLVLSGHSAGGHLVAYLGCAESALTEHDVGRLARIVAISGIADLRPLMRTAMNQNLRIDEDEALTASPALLTPRAGFDLFAWCGGDELTEFRRQNALLAGCFGARVATRRIEAAGLHHMDVIAPLADPGSALTRAVTLA